MERAYSILDIKAFDESAEHVTITGIATTPTPDRMGDVVVPEGAQFSESMPLLWQHQHDQPIGHVKFDKPTKAGIAFTASIPRVSEAGRLKERIDEALHSLKYRLINAVSIGFRVLDDGYEVLKTGGLKFTKTEIMELSLVTIPANSEAVIAAVKSIDQKHLPARGYDDADGNSSPGVSGKRVVQLLKREAKNESRRTNRGP